MKAALMASGVPKWSRCSSSMLVTMAMAGERRRKLPSDSSASATRYSLWPKRALLPKARSFPPTTMVGSQPATSRTVATSEVVVVLPCEPATAMPYLRRMSSASISARRMTGIFWARAKRTSGLSALTAEEMTTTSTPSMLAASWPSMMRAPSDSSRRVTSLARRSLPDTRKPRLTSSSAMPLMPMPPTPTK